LNFSVRLDEVRTTGDDYVVELGNSGGGTGKFETDFYAVDLTLAGRPEASEIVVNGSPATTVLYDDPTTALAAGEVAVLPEGHLRFSAADVGNSIAISRYNVLIHE